MNGIIELKTTGSSVLTGRIVWESVADKDANASTVTVSVQVKKSQTAATYGTWRGSAQVDQTTQAIAQYASVADSWVEVKKITHTVAHNASGYGKCYLYAKVKGPETTTLENAYVEGYKNVTLDTITRAYSVTATSANIGETAAVFLSGQSGYTNSVKWSFGELSGWLDGTGGISDTETRLTASTVPFTLPESFYGQIPGEKTGTVLLTCYTYEGETLIGTSAASFAATASESACAPLLDLTVKDTNPDTIALTGDDSKLVYGASSAKISAVATMRKGAMLSSIYVNETRLPDGDTEITIDPVKTYSSFSATVFDSRGYRADGEIAPEIIRWSKPGCLPTAVWGDVSTGTVDISVSGACFSGSFGAVENAITVQVINPETDEVVTVEATVTDGKFTATASISGLNYKQNYTIQVTVSDKLSVQTETVQLRNADPIYLMNQRKMRYLVPLEAPSINDSAVGALNSAGDFMGLDDVDAFVDSALKTMEMPTIRRWACTYNYKSAYLSVFAAPNENGEPEVVVSLQSQTGTATKNGYNEGTLESEIYWDEWKWSYQYREYTSGIWTVREWSNGEVELWAVVEKTGLSLSSWNSVYGNYNAIPAQTYPVTFVTDPYVLASAVSSGINSYALMSGEIAGTLSASPSFGVLRGGPASSLNVKVSLYVKGIKEE